MNETDSDLPQEYWPRLILRKAKLLHPRLRAEYVVARQLSLESYVVMQGSYASALEALEYVPTTGRPVIVRLNKDGTRDRLYRWRPRKGCWKRVKL